MKMVFFARETERDSCKAAVATGLLMGECNHVSNIMLQNKLSSDDMMRMLIPGSRASVIREESSYFALEGMDYLIWQERSNRLTTESVSEVLMNVSMKTGFIPSGARDVPGLYPDETGRAQMEVVVMLEKLADLVLVDCGGVQDALSREMLRSGCLPVVCLSQKKEEIDRVLIEDQFRTQDPFYIIVDYDFSSVYNKTNIARLYRIPESRIGVIPRSEEFDLFLKRGEAWRFMKKNLGAKIGSKHYFFIHELKECTRKLLMAVNYGA